LKNPIIAVVCAAHQGNGGMYSVDNAALSYFESRPCTFDLLFTQAKQDTSLKIQKKPVALLSKVEDLARYTHIVYWGDFLNNPVYGKLDFSRRDVNYGHSNNLNKAYERWKRIFVDPPVSKNTKLISVGNNFQHDYSSNNREFKTAFELIQNNFHAILPRDPFSYQNLSKLFSLENLNILRQGLDCAFLNSPLSNDSNNSDTFCYSFNRSKIEGTDELVSMIENRYGLKGINVSNWLRLQHHSAHSDFENCRKIMASAKFSLSDTYHFLINSIVVGTPVIAIGKQSPAQIGTLGDFKKYTLFSMLGLEDLYYEINSGNKNSLFGEITSKVEYIISGEFYINDRYSICKNLSENFKSNLDFAVFGNRNFSKCVSAEPSNKTNTSKSFLSVLRRSVLGRTG